MAQSDMPSTSRQKFPNPYLLLGLFTASTAVFIYTVKYREATYPASKFQARPADNPLVPTVRKESK